MRILVVDDSRFEASFLVGILSKLGHVCQQAVDGKAALALSSRGNPSGLDHD